MYNECRWLFCICEQDGLIKKERAKRLRCKKVRKECKKEKEGKDRICRFVKKIENWSEMMAWQGSLQGNTRLPGF